MADGKIVNHWVSDDKDMMRSIERMNRQITKLQDKLRQAGAASMKSSQESAKGLSKHGAAVDGVVTKIAGMAAGYLSIHGVLRGITAELEKQKRIETGAATTQISLSNARSAMLRNLGAVDDKIKREAFGRIGEMAKKSRVPEATLTAATSSALSAFGSLPREAAYQAVGAAAQFLPDAPGQVELVSGSLLDLTKVTKSQKAMANLGYLASVGKASRVVTTELQSANVVPGLIGMSSFGATPKGAGALTAALTTGSGDFTGAVAGTGGINFAQQLEAAFPELATMTDRIHYLQKNPAAAKAIYDKGSFRARTKGPIRELITDPQGMVAGTFEQAYRDIKVPGAGAAGVAQNIIAGYRVDPLNPVAGVSRAGKTALGELQKASMEKPFGRTAQDTAFEAIGQRTWFFTDWGRRLRAHALASAGVPREQIAIQELQAQIASDRGQLGQPGFGPAFQGGTPTAADRAEANILEGLLQNLLDETRRHNGKVEGGRPSVRQEQ